MGPSLFITGATGYIGGDALYRIVEAHPDWEITAIVRNSDKGAKVAQHFAKVRLVYGDLNSTDLLEEEASKADIVLHTANCDHKASATAMLKGMARSSKPQVFYIQTSGTSILAQESFAKNVFGEKLSRSYDDWDEVAELFKIPDDAPHRPADKIVQAAGSDKVKIAIVCPPCIYGPGRGPDNQRSIQLYNAAKSMIQHKQGWMPGKGENVWHEIHVQDLSDLYLLLAEAAVNGGPPATWNDQGYYFAENGSFTWGEMLKAVAKDAHRKGYLQSDEVAHLTPEEINPLFHNGAFYVGTDSRGVAKRGKNLLGWKPHRPAMIDLVSSVVDEEAELLGVKKRHAATVED
jgi:nucleoside-diphosphate-sugar epimerase